VAAAPLVTELHRRHPEYRLVVTTVTETGREAVEQRLAGIAEHRYAPLDYPWAVQAALRAIRPSVYVFVETELWPNLLRALRRRGVPVIMANGRVSSRSYARQRLPLVRSLFRDLLRQVSFILVQSNRDADRLVALGADPARVKRSGNLKFDQAVSLKTAAGATLSRASLGLGEQEDVIVAGSTHAGEEEHLVTSYQRLLPEYPRLVMILAPRHLERAPVVAEMIASRGLCVVKRSDGALGQGPAPPKEGPRVLLLDTRGELATVYRFATVAFVGGTLVPVGGHNLLEPAFWNKPVYFGPYTDHCEEMAQLLIDAGGGRRVATGDDLVDLWRAQFHDRAALERMGLAARQVVEDNQGALEQTLEVIESFLSRSSSQADQPISRLKLGLLPNP
jgi:3-deoxy-D-manno-octulosonic-acid transferase